MEPVAKKGLYISLFISLLLPLLQQCLPFITSGKLMGYFSESPDITFSFQKWWDGSYQRAKESYINDHIGFRPDLVRSNGQIDYSLFHKANYAGASVGQDNYLFLDGYISAYYGEDYAGLPRLKKQMVRLKALQDTFATMGKSIILVYAPCKAWYCTRYLPDHAKKAEHLPNNYKTCARLGDSLGINYIDMNAWFISMREKTSELLFAKQGIHWTNYGSVLGGDSLVKYMEHLRHIHLPHPYWTKAEHTSKALYPDNDLANILNTIWPPTTETFFYPELHYTHDSTTTKLKVIHIGDSFNFNMVITGFMKNVYSEWQYWFFFKNVFTNKSDDIWKYNQIEELNWKDEIKKADCIVLLNTVKNTDNIASGFIDSAYNYYFQER